MPSAPTDVGEVAGQSRPAVARPRICYVVAPDGQAGGGMGRVKDYVMSAGRDRDGTIEFRQLITRDQRGFAWSMLLTLRAVALIWLARVSGRLAFVHVNFGDKASAVRKGIVVTLGRLMGAPVVLHLHAVELHDHYAAASPLLRALIRAPFHAASCCIVLGALWERWLTEELGVPAERVSIVTNGVPVPLGPIRAADARGVVRLLFLGNLMERKGVSDLLRALALLPQPLPDWHLTLAGGGDLDRYRSLAADLSLAGRLDFVGWVDQPRARQLLRETDLLVLPSYDEGLPLVILEALGSGAPVLCTQVGAIPEVLNDGIDVVFCKVGDPGNLADRLATLIADPPLRHRLSIAGRAAYVERFSLPAFLDVLFAVYRAQLGLAVVPPEIAPAKLVAA